MFRFLFPEGKNKALTFSYDDGIVLDQKLIGIFRDHNLKGTFNLNGGCLDREKFNSWRRYPDTKIRYCDKSEVADVYQGMEIAGHGFQHLKLSLLNHVQLIEEIHEDRKNLEALCGYPVSGYAYPYGTYNDNVVNQLKSMGISYARTTVSTHKFELPEDFLLWNPTAHHDDPDLFELGKQFTDLTTKNMNVFYVWGHSFEFAAKDNWKRIEDFCEMMGNHDDIWYATNMEIYDYVMAVRNVKISVDSHILTNMSCFDIWLVQDDDTKVCIPAGKTIKL